MALRDLLLSIGLSLLSGCNAAAPGRSYDFGGGGGERDLSSGPGGNPDLAGVDNDAAFCAAEQKTAQQVPLDIYIMLDQSGSMGDTVSGGSTKWSAVSQALEDFLQQQNLNGVSAGIQYFGVPAGGMMCPVLCAKDADCGSCGPCFLALCSGALTMPGGDSCTAADYAKPEVEISPLPGAAPALVASIMKHGPSTSTPTSAALQGAVDHAKAWAQQHPGHVVIDIFATDGDPTECDTNLTNIDAIAKSGATGNPAILTFVIGVGSSLPALDGIASAGGTKMAYLVDTNQNVNQQFLAALNMIRGSALGCQYQIPVPTSGQPDFTKVNVQYTPGSGGAPSVLPNVPNAAACPMNGAGWYYDNPTAPTQIILCPGSCTTVSADTTGSIDILLGCQTIGVS
jgi:hypothetical protein